MKQLIINALAFAEKAAVPSQMKEVTNVMETYIKNSFVSLRSAKIKNPDADVCLIINTSLPEEFADFFLKNEIKVYVVSYDKYKMPSNFQWQLAFFKLFALHYAIYNLNYDSYLMVDTDTYCCTNFNDLWIEAKENILLYPIPHVYNELTRKQIIDGYKNLYGIEESIVNYGGELVAGSRELLKEFFKHCVQVQDDVINNLDKVSTNIGDEFMIGIAASKMRNKVLPAGAYLDRYWTGKTHYVCSTNYPNIAIWHLPAEKSYSMLKLFKYYQQNGNFPELKKVAKWIGFPKRTRTHALPFYIHRFKQKYLKK